MRAFMLRHGPDFGVANTSLREEASAWDGLISSTYTMLDDAQCASTGLTPNWWRPAGMVQARGYAGCNASGTAADEFGSEAARGVWRVALDALWQPSAASQRYVWRVARHMLSLLDAGGGTPRKGGGGGGGGASFGELRVDPSCTSVRAIHANWQGNAFMFGPMAAALLVALPEAEGLGRVQRDGLGLMSERIAATKIDSYYSGSWVALATATLNGDFGAACARLGLPRGCPAAAD